MATTRFTTEQVIAQEQRFDALLLEAKMLTKIGKVICKKITDGVFVHRYVNAILIAKNVQPCMYKPSDLRFMYNELLKHLAVTTYVDSCVKATLP